MAKVFYIPYAKYEFHSELRQEELIAKIQYQISNHDLFGELTVKNKGKFSGSINLTTGEFQIRKRLNDRNNFNSTLRGRIVKMDTGSKVKIILKLPTFSYIFLTIFCIIWALIGFSNINSPEDAIWPIGGLAFVYFLTFFGFNMGAGAALDALYELV